MAERTNVTPLTLTPWHSWKRTRKGRGFNFWVNAP